MSNLTKSTWQYLSFISLENFTFYFPWLFTVINMENLPKFPREFLTFIAMAIFTIHLIFINMADFTFIFAHNY